MEINDQHRPGKSSNSAFRNSDRPMLFIILHPKSGVILIEIYDLYLVLTPLEIKQANKTVAYPFEITCPFEIASKISDFFSNIGHTFAAKSENS